jgi:hypothetical protein
MIFTHTGNAGDIVFSIPTINHLSPVLGETILYVKPLPYAYGNQWEFVKDLLLQNGIREVIPFIPPNDNWNYFQWQGLKFDYDLDTARYQRERGRIHIIKRYFDTFGIRKNHSVPFLKIDNYFKREENFALIHLTPRWNGLQYDWERIYDFAKKKHEKIYFIGFPSEHLDFTLKFGEIEHLITETLLEVGRLVRDCEALYCNQGVVLTIAQGLGKEYYLVMNNNKTNCHLGTPNEHLFGREWLAAHHTFTGKELPDSHYITKPL